MAYQTNFADRVRKFLTQIPAIEIAEKKMFGGLAFMVNGKMCINIGESKLMCRFDPSLQDQIAERTGFLPLRMRGKEYKGYCYVEPAGFKSKNDFEFWLHLCLDFNSRAKASKKRKE